MTQAGGAVGADLPADLAADLAAASLTLARRFATGATMWCLAPLWEPHAQHIAVEFLHPVIAGKRALPAVAMTGPDVVAEARASVRPGDIVVAVAGAGEPDVRSVMLRAPAWGTTTVWIGNGARPAPGAADHLLWIDDPDPLLPATGGFLLLYHLLWELTHVCVEHPELLGPATGHGTDGASITCGGEGRLGEVISPAADGVAVVRTAAGEESVATVLVDPVAPGELLLVHGGAAVSRLDEEPGR